MKNSSDFFLNYQSVIQTLRRGIPVRLYQSAYTKLGPSEITNDHNQYILKVFGKQLPVYGLAGRGRRFSIVIHSENRSIRTEYISITMMGCIVILFLQFQKNFFHLFPGTHRKGKGKKPASFFFVKSF